ncbi:hypothetical protein CLIB1444_01S00320 [[Candida] jaroonii]|uniref:Uncharacterized protein n=1 Tax=[Candida] jaroonii TaxID=467808 RepID=A0ACA9XZT2_9ASCO|nr:hypothetical protein CLIB1444_01S00320 [[Candida] jaroonii]
MIDSSELKLIKEFLDLDDLSSHSSSFSRNKFSPGGTQPLSKRPVSEQLDIRNSNFKDEILFIDPITSRPHSESPGTSFFRSKTVPQSNSSVENARISVTEKSTISSPLNKILKKNIFPESSSSSLSNLSQDSLIEINDSNIFVIKNDFICGVVGKNGQQCLRTLSCKFHSLQDKYKVQRTEHLSDLLLKEAKFSRFFFKQRKFILHYFRTCINEDPNHGARSGKVLLMYDLLEEGYYQQPQENIVLGTNIPLSDIVEPIRKRRRITRSQVSKQILRRTPDSYTESNSSSLSEKPNNSPLTDLGTNPESTDSPSSPTDSTNSKNRSFTSATKTESYETTSKTGSYSTSCKTESKTGSNWTNSTNRKSSTSTTSKSTDSFTSKSSYSEQNKRKNYLRKLSKQTSSRIKETVAYLHYKFQNFNREEFLHQYSQTSKDVEK